MKNSWRVIAQFSATLFIFTIGVRYCHAEDAGCPDQNVTISAISYDISDWTPRILFSGQDASKNWNTLGYAHGLDTFNGKAMLEIAALAYTTGATVQTSCSGNDISLIRLMP
ncbi:MULTISPECIES: hypothetical protein [Burkholderia]|uniref:hypothetical protein n=1 Tax=Burkholderia TaxID=32008 RepID=UPI000841FF11|nr:MULTISPECIES: hypothetical protein [unclassified Burkholderia]AOK30665.1 hypothetical protein AQ611_15675 [Burkholderia sp. Bp7605]